MDHDELLRRLDGHVERGNEIMARSNEVMARSNEVMARNELAFRENTRAFNELSGFLHVQTLAMRALTREIRQRTDEFVAEMRAQRQALFRILDRLDENRGGAAGA